MARTLNWWGVNCGSLANRGTAVGGGGRSHSGVHRNPVSRGVSCCDEVRSWVSLQSSLFDSKSRHYDDMDSASWDWCFFLFLFVKRLLCRWRIFCPCVAFFSERGYRGFGQSSASFAESVTESTSGRAVLHWGVVFSVPFGVHVGLAALSQSMLRGFRRVSKVYAQHLPQKVLVKCSSAWGWWIVRCGLKDVSSLSVPSGWIMAAPVLTQKACNAHSR